MKRSRKSVLPAGWADRFFRAADLDTSYLELEGVQHFYAETMRGAIRSIQMRFPEAWSHFDQAAELVLTAEETVPNLVRQFELEIYRFFNALYEAPVDPEVELPDFTAPDIDPLILEQFPEVKYVLDQRKASEALLRLHLGQCEESEAIFNELISENPDTDPAQLAFHYVALACCQESLGRSAEALTTLENASFATQTIGETLNAAMLSARLVSVYRYMERPDEADGWTEFLLRLECPQATKDVFLRRAERLDARCLEERRLLVY